MPADTAPAWDGVPLNPERDGWHWIAGPEHPAAIVWHANTQNWVLGALGLPPTMFITATYLAPCLTPSEVQAREAAAWAAGAAAMREMAASYCHGRTTSRSFGSWADAFEAAEGGVRALPLPPMPTQGGNADE